MSEAPCSKSSCWRLPALKLGTAVDYRMSADAEILVKALATKANCVTEPVSRMGKIDEKEQAIRTCHVLDP